MAIQPFQQAHRQPPVNGRVECPWCGAAITMHAPGLTSQIGGWGPSMYEIQLEVSIHHPQATRGCTELLSWIRAEYGDYLTALLAGMAEGMKRWLNTDGTYTEEN